MIPKRIPIESVRPTLDDAVRMSVHAIADCLRQFHSVSEEELARTEAEKIVAGHWYGRVAGFHHEDDFLHLTRDMLLFLHGGGARSAVSDQLAYCFSGFMPTYGAACAVLTIVADGGTWTDLQAFMHAHSYGNARAYVENFDWKGGQKKVDAEIRAWRDVLQRQIDRIHALRQQSTPVRLAFVAPGLPPGVALPPPAPVAPFAPPLPRPGPMPLNPSPGLALRLAPWLGRGVVLLTLLLTPSNVGQKNSEVEWLRKRDDALKKKQLLVRDIEEVIEVTVNQTNNSCRPQRELNQENGAKCENDGYALMEGAFNFKRLVDPPKGRGLDGLFEKLDPDNGPYPMPDTVIVPQPGTVEFIPLEARPPHSRYDFFGQPKRRKYPKYVVFEAKNIAQALGKDDHEGIKKIARSRLKNTCTGVQMSEPWSEDRIPQALKRQNPGARSEALRRAKSRDIFKSGYARWIFICFPGAGINIKRYVFIDVEASGMDLSAKPKNRRISLSISNYYG